MPPRKRTNLKANEDKTVAERSNNVATQAKSAPSRRNLRGRTGGLKDMPNMPLDILIEIFSLMCPRDLLSLARSSKDFRALLMSRNSESLWKAARQQVAGLPECPPYLSEPAYANLVFFAHCHRCLKPNTKSVIWQFSARYCSKCKDDLLVYPFVHSEYVEQVQNELGLQHADIFTVHVMAATKGSKLDGAFYHVPDVEAFKAKYTSLSTIEEKREFAKGITEQVKTQNKFAGYMRLWKLDQEESRSVELDAIKEARFEAIVERLRDEDWARDELDSMSAYELADLRRHKACRKSQKLTEHGWQSIRHDLVQFMESIRKSRLEAQHRTAIIDRIGILLDVITQSEQSGPPRSAETDWHPHFADYAFMSAFRGILEAPTETEVNTEEFQALLHHELPSLRDAWLKERRMELESKVTITCGRDDVPLLSLAVVTFECNRCERVGLRWPQILAHDCGAPPSMQLLDMAVRKFWMAATLICRTRGQPLKWSANIRRHFSFDRSHLERTRAVIEACGQDPNVVTYEEMEACGVRLVCVPCVSSKANCEALDWRAAILYDGVDFDDPASWTSIVAGHTPSFQRLDDEHTAQVKLLEAKSLQQAIPDILTTPITIFGCTRCRQHLKSLGTVTEHCTSKHGIEDPALGADYYLHADSPKLRPPPIRIYAQGQDMHPTAIANVEAQRAFVSSSLFPPS